MTNTKLHFVKKTNARKKNNRNWIKLIFTRRPLAGSLALFCASDEAPQTQSKNRITWTSSNSTELILATIQTKLNSRSRGYPAYFRIYSFFLISILNFHSIYDAQHGPKKSMFKHEHRRLREKRSILRTGFVHVPTDAWARRVIVMLMNVTNVRVARCTVDGPRCILPRLWK